MSQLRQSNPLATNSNKQTLAAQPTWRRAANLLFRSFRWTVHTAISGLTLSVAVLLLASAYSDMISPTVWIVSAYFGLAFPILLLGTLLLLVCLVVAKRWRPVLVLVLALLICSGRIWRYCPLHFSDQSAVTNLLVQNGEEMRTPVDTFRLMTYNTCSLGKVKIERGDADIPMLDMIADCGADVVCLQEYIFAKSQKKNNEEALRARLLRQYPHYYLLKYPSQTNMGVAIYSKWPIVYQEKIETDSKRQIRVFYSELNVRGRRVALVNCHLRCNSISVENRELFHNQVRNFKPDSLMRMEDGFRQLGPSYTDRAGEVAAINHYLRQRREKTKEELPLLICGDMNDTPVSFAYRALRGSLGDTWVDAGCGPGITFRYAPFWFRIDHIFHSDHFRALRVRVLDECKMSDHYPVMATYQLLPIGE